MPLNHRLECCSRLLAESLVVVTILKICKTRVQATRSGQYIAFAHYCRMIRRGARRFDSQSTEKDLYHVAVENPSGQQVLVVTNPGSARKAALRMG